MRISILFLFIFCFACRNEPSEENKTANEKSSAFENYLDAFEDIGMPAKYYSDSLISNLDTLGTESIKTFIIEASTDTNQLINWTIDKLPLMNQGWYGILPLFKIKTDSTRILFLFAFEKISESDGAVWKLFRLNYATTGKLKSAIYISEHSEFYSTFITENEELQCAKMTETLNLFSLEIQSGNQLQICEYTIEKLEYQEDFPNDTSYETTNKSEPICKTI